MGTAGASAVTRAGVRARCAQVAFTFVFQALVLFGGAGRLGWVWAWVYLGLCALSFAVNATLLLRHGADLVAERGHLGGMRRWDRWISLGSSLASWVALPLVAALDERCGWTAMAAGWHLLGAAVLVAASALSGWAMHANAFFSSAVRIQTERGHTVCRTGPYRFVRHPGYVGFILLWLATAVLLGSLWALVPAAVAGGFLVVRAAFEDRTLRAELPGYAEYAAEVRWGLVPGIW